MPASLNQFVYGADNPITLSDPTGMIVTKGTKGGEDECRACTAKILQKFEPHTCTACVYDPGEYQTWIENHRVWIQRASRAFDVPASVIAGVLATEFETTPKSR